MIKLVVSDLDGTLLLPDKKLPDETFGIIEKLYKKGIIFVPASGRQLPNVKLMFRPVLDKIAIIAENGGLCLYGGGIIFSDPTPAADADYALNVIDGIRGLYPLLSCTDCAYYVSDNGKFGGIVRKLYSRTKKLDSFKGVAQRETVLKISVWDEFPPCAEHGGKILPPKIKGLRTMVSGYDWLDVSTPAANKGRALNALMTALSVTPDECMAFGDHMNDLEMLETSGHPYVTANAFTALKERIGREIGSNAEKGVILKLQELL